MLWLSFPKIPMTQFRLASLAIISKASYELIRLMLDRELSDLSER